MTDTQIGEKYNHLEEKKAKIEYMVRFEPATGKFEHSGSNICSLWAGYPVHTEQKKMEELKHNRKRVTRNCKHMKEKKKPRD